jgi:hypothetical protein
MNRPGYTLIGLCVERDAEKVECLLLEGSRCSDHLEGG